MRKKKTTYIHARVTREDLARLKRLARRTGMTMTEILREGISLVATQQETRESMAKFMSPTP